MVRTNVLIETSWKRAEFIEPMYLLQVFGCTSLYKYTLKLLIF